MPSDSTEKAKQVNEIKAENNIVDENLSVFLVKIADARMMGIKEGQEAQQKGTTEDIRNYGSWMISEQSELLKQINLIAKTKNVTLPTSISNDKQDGLSDLQKKNGVDFDEKFIKMMTIDHERDLKDFKKAMEFEDQRVASFASKYLPMVQSHLDKINQIHKRYKSK